MNGWESWAANLAALRRNYIRPRGVYGMVTDDELHFLETYARFSYTGEGKIIDLGSWLGASAGALARGVRDNPLHARFAQPIDSYDQFIWQDWMTPIARGMGAPCVLRNGEDFFPYAHAALKDSLHWVRLCRTDLTQEQVIQDPIEFLMIDAMKSWALANAISKNFLPKLIPGRSLVVHQDFSHYHPITATNHLLMWSLRDWLEPVHQVPNSTSSVFFLTRPLYKQDIPCFDPKNVPLETIEAAWRYSLGFAGSWAVAGIRLCKVLFLLELERYGAGVVAAGEFRGSGATIQGTAWHDVLAMMTALRQRASSSSEGREAVKQAGELLGLPMTA